jgi:putative flavoprotein involved in K+ transport
LTQSGHCRLDNRRAATEYANRDPVVLVVGGGQAGLSAAACLTQLGVDTLIVDRENRVGDNWRLVGAKRT